MKRDLDLIRRILKDVEGMPAGKPLGNITYPGYSKEIIHEHIDLLDQAKFIEVATFKAGTAKNIIKYQINRLTWLGHEFLDAAKDDSIWNKAKEKFLKPTVSFSFDLLLDWLKMKAREKIGLR